MTILWNGLASGLAPGVADYFTSLIDPLPDRYTVQQGFRTFAQQAALYNKGRNAAGVIVAPADTVTNAKPGQSSHNYGVAIDVYPIVNGAIDWGFDGNASQPTPAAAPAWQALWDAADATGSIVKGADFRLSSGYDPGHLELAGWKDVVANPTFYNAASNTWLQSPLASIGGDGGGNTPTSADGDAPTDGPSAPPSLATRVQNWLELDPGVTIGVAAIVGLLLLLRLRRHAT